MTAMSITVARIFLVEKTLTRPQEVGISLRRPTNIIVEMRGSMVNGYGSRYHEYNITPPPSPPTASLHKPLSPFPFSDRPHVTHATILYPP